jgi:hypothetical protein
LKGVAINGITPANSTCLLNGAGTFSWLLAFDTASGTVKTGGAKPPQDPALGYSFVDKDYPIIGGTIHIAPVTLTAPISAACTTDSTAGDVNLPVYLDMQATKVIVLPLRQARFVSVTISGNHDCIGKYNAAGLDPAYGCVPDAQTPAFFPGAQVTAFINLEEADAIPVDPVALSLCVVLSGDVATYGDGSSPTNRCKRTAGAIDVHGDWCSATDQPATAQCHDAVHFAGAFAASGVIIN